MGSLQKIDNPTKRGGNGRHERAGMARGPQEIREPPLDDALSRAISEAAYYLAEARGFASGHELEDWIEAESRVVGANHMADLH